MRVHNRGRCYHLEVSAVWHLSTIYGLHGDQARPEPDSSFALQDYLQFERLPFQGLEQELYWILFVIPRLTV